MPHLSDSIVNVIAVILSIGSIIVPIVWAALMFKMSTLFVSKTEFSELKEQLSVEHQENRDEFATIRGDIKTLLAR